MKRYTDASAEPHCSGVKLKKVRFKVKGKLAPRYVGPFKIVGHRGEVAYQLELPPQLSDVHDVFHVSQLKKCLLVPEEQLPMEELDLGGDLTQEIFHVSQLKKCL
jgi:hypothetical protein